MPDSTDEDVTHGHLLAGRVRYRQPTSGHRSGIEPVFLAAAVPARPGERVLEAGTGAGAALLCLAARVPGVLGVGVEADAALCALAARNFRALDPERLAAARADIRDLPAAGAKATFDHAMANPPWHHAAGTPSPDRARELARRSTPDLLDEWLAALARSVRSRGTITLVTAPGTAPQFLGSLARHGLGSPSLFPLWPRRDAGAKLLLMRAVRDGRASLRLLSGLVLHEADGRFTPGAEAVLRDGAALAWEQRA